MLAGLFFWPNTLEWDGQGEIIYEEPVLEQDPPYRKISLPFQFRVNNQFQEVSLPLLTPRTIQKVHFQISSNFFRSLAVDQITLTSTEGKVIPIFDTKRADWSQWYYGAMSSFYYYQISQNSLEKYKKAGLGQELISQLETLKEKLFWSKKAFHAALKEVPSPPGWQQRAIIRDYAQRPLYFESSSTDPSFRMISHNFWVEQVSKITLRFRAIQSPTIGQWLFDDVLHFLIPMIGLPFLIIIVFIVGWYFAKRSGIPWQLDGSEHSITHTTDSCSKAFTMLKYGFIAITIGAICYWGWLLWITPFLGDDLWHRERVAGRTFWELITQPIFGDLHHYPIFHLWYWMLSILPADPLWMKSANLGLLILTCVLFYYYLKQAGIGSWVRWMAIALFVTSPTIIQTIIWIAAVLHWLGALFILAGLMLYPRSTESCHTWRWIGAGLCLILAIMTSEFMYACCGMLFVIVALKYYKHPRIFLGALGFLAIMLAFVAWRNVLVTGNWYQLSPPAYENRPFQLSDLYHTFQEILEYSHPLALVQTFWPQGYFEEISLSLEKIFLLTLGYIGLWWVTLRRPERNGWDILIMGVGTPLMIIFGKGHIFGQERYLIIMIIAQTLGLAFFVDHVQSKVQLEKWNMIRLGMGALMLGVVLINLNSLCQRTLDHVAPNAMRHHQFIKLAKQEFPDSSHPIGLVDSLYRFDFPTKSREVRPLPENSLYERQIMLRNVGLPICIYDLTESPKDFRYEALQIPDQHLRSIGNIKVNCNWPPVELRCFKYHYTGRITGEFRLHTGLVILTYFTDEITQNYQELQINCKS
ncbi:MAG: hypothetical protein HQM14_15440 [SAR324 cluster bacterium]|nr:hypothetical protein [SAR324 cluster bacterium]